MDGVQPYRRVPHKRRCRNERHLYFMKQRAQDEADKSHVMREWKPAYAVVAIAVGLQVFPHDRPGIGPQTRMRNFHRSGTTGAAGGKLQKNNIVASDLNWLARIRIRRVIFQRFRSDYSAERRRQSDVPPYFLGDLAGRSEVGGLAKESRYEITGGRHHQRQPVSLPEPTGAKVRGAIDCLAAQAIPAHEIFPATGSDEREPLLGSISSRIKRCDQICWLISYQ